MTTMILSAFLHGQETVTEIGRFDDVVLGFAQVGITIKGTGCVQSKDYRTMLEELLLKEHTDFLQVEIEEPKLLFEGRFSVNRVHMLDSISFELTLETQPGMEIF